MGTHVHNTHVYIYIYILTSQDCTMHRAPHIARVEIEGVAPYLVTNLKSRICAKSCWIACLIRALQLLCKHVRQRPILLNNNNSRGPEDICSTNK